LAPCCHYLCTYDAFAGKEYWIQLGFTEEDFDVAVAVSQWYSMKKKHCISTNADETAVYTDVVEAIDKVCASLKHLTYPPPALSSEEFEKAFSSDEKSALGGDIKRLLDMLRVAKLQQLGYRAEVILYTNRSIENRLLVGSTV
jgi:tRNA:m4X modification enzyme